MLFFLYYLNVFYFINSLEPPKISGKLENVTVNEGQDASFTVKFSGKPKPSVKWFKEDEELVIDNDLIELKDLEDSNILVIKSAKLNNAGNYYVQLSNEVTSVNSNKAQLIVNKAPSFIKVPEPLEPLNKDSSVSIEYYIEGTPKPAVNWYN